MIRRWLIVIRQEIKIKSCKDLCSNKSIPKNISSNMLNQIQFLLISKNGYMNKVYNLIYLICIPGKIFEGVICEIYFKTKSIINEQEHDAFKCLLYALYSQPLMLCLIESKQMRNTVFCKASDNIHDSILLIKLENGSMLRGIRLPWLLIISHIFIWYTPRV